VGQLLLDAIMEPIPVEGDGEPFVLAGHVVGTDRKVLPVCAPRSGVEAEDQGVMEAEARDLKHPPEHAERRGRPAQEAQGKSRHRAEAVTGEEKRHERHPREPALVGVRE